MRNYNEIAKLVLEMVQERTNLELAKRTRKREYVMARSIYWGICHEFNILTKHEMGKTLGRDHATVIHSINNVYNNLDQWKDELYISMRDKTKEYIEPLIDQEHFASYEYKTRRGPKLKKLSPNDFYKEKLIRLRYRFGRLLYDIKEGNVDDVVKEMETIKEEQCFI